MGWWIVLSTAAALIPSLSSVYTDQRTRVASAAQASAAEASRVASEAAERAENARRLAFEAIGNSHKKDMFSRTVQIPGNAFNTGSAFTSVFTATAIAGVVLLAKQADELTKLCAHVKDIREELGAQTTAMIQGWQNKGYGDFIYKFLETEIHDCGGEASVGHHAFYIYNPTTSADVVFKRKVRDSPLPSSFGGFSSDIEAIFRLMWANRRTLQATIPRDEADAIVFHLLVPAKRTMAVIDRMVIHKSIGKLIIKGHRDDGSCYAWFNFVRLPQQVTLDDIGNLNMDTADRDDEKKKVLACAGGGVACWAGVLASGFLFPPALPVFFYGFMGSVIGGMTCISTGIVQGATRPEPRVLGPPH